MKEYESLKELKSKEVENRDWRKVVIDRNSWVTVVAPHGKTIEPFTQFIANEIAGDNFSLFIFEGLRKNDPDRKWLHVRSENYSDPELTTLQSKSRVTLSIHGASDRDEVPKLVTHIGGGNELLRDMIWHSLESYGFNVVLGTGHLAGVHETNFVNVTKETGVQFEISRSEREALVKDARRLKGYGDAVREALASYIHS